MNRNIVLASASPRRRDILEQIGLQFKICPSTAEEKLNGEPPPEAVELLSAQKAADIAAGREAENGMELVIIGADTVVACDGRILGKPSDREDAFRMISMLQGRKHEVFTGVTLIVKREGLEARRTFHEATEVEFYPVDSREIQEYLNTDEPWDKAGAYAVQGRFAEYVKGIRGDFHTVVGLPVARLMQELKKIEKEMDEYL